MIVVKTMELTWFWPRAAGQTVPHCPTRCCTRLPAPGASLGEGESVGFNASAGQLATLAEGPHQPLYRYERRLEGAQGRDENGPWTTVRSSSAPATTA